MPLEDGMYINNLNPDNPYPSDTKREGDDHIRLIKKVLKNSFPTVAGPMKLTREGAVVTGSGAFLTSADDGSHFFVTTGAGGATVVMPPLAGCPLGWRIRLTKISADANPIVVRGSEQNVMYGQGGLVDFLRREVPFFTSVVTSTTAGWHCTRAWTQIVGTVVGAVVAGFQPGTGRLPGTLPSYGGAVPQSAFPELYSVIGGLTQNYGAAFPYPQTALVITE